MISAKELRKSYGKAEALRGVGFEVGHGELFGIIGPDGAGKTTLFRVLATLILADSGSACVDGLDVVADYEEIRKRIGYMPGRFSLYQDLTVEENLEFFATVFDVDVDANYGLVSDIYERLAPFKNRRAGALSGGMKQKLALCCALIHKPTVLFLDEPTTGVDPVSRKEFWEMLKRLKAAGVTILVSTPYMDEAALCDRVALMQGGRFLDIDTPAGIVANYRHELWAIRARRMSRLLGDLRAQPETLSCFAFGDAHHLAAKPGALSPESLVRRLKSLGHEDVAVERLQPGIEDCFLDLSAADGRTR
jgi:ABC-type multidrug transport system ATPase subunit